MSSWWQLRSLPIHCGLGCSMDFLGSLLNPPQSLEKFKLIAGRFSGVPKWISRLNLLSFMQITICKQGREQLKILGELPLLRRLILGLDFITENLIVIESGWFRELERFSVDCPMPWLSFSTESMQSLTYLELKLCACPVSQTSYGGPSGIDKLQSIREVSLCYNPWEMLSPNISTIVGAMTKAVREHHNRIRIDLFINGVQDYSIQDTEEETDNAAGTGSGTDAGSEDIQKTDEELIGNITSRVQSTTEIEEMESDG